MESAQPLIVIAEDDDDMREIVTRSLRQLGYRVEATCDGRELCDRVAFHLATRCTPTLVLSDIGLPVRDGVQVSRWMHANAPGIPTILMTASRDQRVWEEAAAAGTSRVLLKPFTREELSATLERTIGRLRV